ncbi:MAG: hypothetical protein M0Q53_20365 [Prolixibacteraceae bacterium]|nr:hypothetical protein [Prolixibacteraceae bacterium]
MKKSLFIGLIVLLTMTSCKKLGNEVFFKIGSGQEYTFSDIELYDTSTHILYFKNVQYEFKDILASSFAFMDDGGLIYQGSFVPGYSSSIPYGPFIMSAPTYGNYALRIENWHSEKPDIRNNPRIIDILKQHDLLHPGLVISSSSIEISGTQLTFKFTVTNQDQSDLMIIDFDKTGPNLFHYFTNGLRIYDLAHNEVFSSNIQHLAPNPWNSWKSEWLSELKSGDSKQFTINYTINNPINPGEYDTTFKFPGLAYQVT